MNKQETAEVESLVSRLKGAYDAGDAAEMRSCFDSASSIGVIIGLFWHLQSIQKKPWSFPTDDDMKKTSELVNRAFPEAVEFETVVRTYIDKHFAGGKYVGLAAQLPEDLKAIMDAAKPVTLLLAWSNLTSGGVEKVEFAKAVHRIMGMRVVKVFDGFNSQALK